MIKVTIELFPFGSETNKRTIGEMKIWNDLSGSLSNGNYQFKIFKKNSKAIWKTGKIENFKRKRFLVWDLLYLCLKNVLENKHNGKKNMG